MRNGANVRAEAGPCNPYQPQVCETSWFTAGGMGRPTAPERAPCEGERSQYRVLDQKPAKSLYSSCPPLIQAYDVPNDDLGVIGNIKSVIELCRLSPSDNTIITLPMAAGAMNFPKAANSHMAHGIWLRYAYQALQVTAPVLTVTTTNCLTTVGAQPANRNITFQLEDGCLVGEVYIPFAAPQQGTNNWAPVAVTAVAAVANVAVTGFAAVAGTVSVQYVGSYSQNLENIVAGLNGAKAKT